MKSYLLALFLPLLAPQASAQEKTAVKIDEAMLKRVVAEVFPEIKKETEVDPNNVVRLRLAKGNELGQIVQKDMMEMAKLGDSDKVPSRIRLASRLMRRMLLAKFDWREREILLCPNNFKWQAKAIKKPELNSEAAFRAVVIHECIHAIDEHQLQWSKKLLTLPNQRRLEVYNAVIEGHAQHVTARICESNGWSKGFEIFTSAIGQNPPGLGEADRLMSQVRTANLQAAYRDGKRFIDFILDKQGKEGIRQAFRAPPEDFEAVLHPDWYLDPKKRPAQIHDLEKPIAHVIESHKEDWRPTKTSLTPAQLKASMALSGPEDSERILKHMRQNKVVVLKAKPGRLAVVALFEFDSPQEATFYVLAGERLSRIKDEKMVKGTVRITDAHYEPVRREDWQGVYFEKELRVVFKKSKVYSLLGAKGSVAVEILYSDSETNRAHLEKMATTLLDLSLVKQAPAKAPKKAAKR
ncbi:MAG: hypothetical protein V3U11_01000 [Planctomycetota bacterium]